MKQEYIEKILPTKLKRFGITWLSAILVLSAGGPVGLSSGKASAEPASFAGKEVQPSPVTVGASVYADVYFPKKPRIHDIQGGAHRSPYEGQKVADIEGVVTMVKGSSFYIQEMDDQVDQDEKTSEAILVYKPSHGAQVGDEVRVSGSVKEYTERTYASKPIDLTTTEIVASSVKVIANDRPLPSPILLGEQGRVMPTSVVDNDGMTVFDPQEDGLDFFESLEGMRVELKDATVIGPYGYEIPVRIDNGPNTGEVVTEAGGLMLTERSLNPQRILIDAKPSAPLKTGDRFAGPITGVVSYSFSNYKLLPERLPGIVSGGLQPTNTRLIRDDRKLTVASFNVENFDPGDGKRIDQLGQAIAVNLNHPDIIGLLEVQDNNGEKDDGTTDASESFRVLIEAIRAHGGPEYAFTDIAPENNKDGGAPGGNIRVGFLYNSQRVTLTDKPKGDSVTSVTYGVQGLSLNPGRIDPLNASFEDSRKPLAAEFEFQGQQVIVVANHFNSKGGDQAPFGGIQPPVRSSEIQRAKIATIVNGFVKSVLQVNPKANMVVLGDLNDFQFSETLALLRGHELTNLIDNLDEKERYSYIYEGNSQTLDHMLVSPSLSKTSVLDIVHMNADFSTADGRVSDHDPLVAQIDLPRKTEEPPTDGGSGRNDDDDDDEDQQDNVGNANAGNSSSSNMNGTVNGQGQTASSEPNGSSLSGTNVVQVKSVMIGVEQNGLKKAVAQVPAAEIQKAIQNGAKGTLVIRAGEQVEARTYEVHLSGEALGAVLNDRIHTLRVETPQGGYEVATSRLSLQKLADTWQVPVKQISLSFSIALNEELAKRLDVPTGRKLLQALDIAAELRNEDGRKQLLAGNGDSGSGYERYLLRVPATVDADQFAVVKVSTNQAGQLSYQPVPFHAASEEITVYGRSGGTYAVLDGGASGEVRSFIDISGHWAQQDITRLATRLLVTGTDSTASTASATRERDLANMHFEPEGQVRRSELAAMLVRVLGLERTDRTLTSFDDVLTESWYADSVRTAAAAGLINGYADGSFRPDTPVSREELAVITERALRFAGNTEEHTGEVSESISVSLSDAQEISTWAAPAVKTLSGLGIMKGDEKGCFGPDTSVTRAEAAAVLSRTLDKLHWE
ncbi:S-layer homology domain-containing protein [Paenibacillus polymyxa]|uniref:S-layer homology domain-containing protein n=1 Tax=Paenibacillus polymyxa TaxID=1406 RepID=UPI002221967D|nr:S-layer homology domain-containing protein [Paenibacillus polymyxa]